MLIATLALMLAADSSPRAAVRLCNDMKVTVGGATFEAQGGGANVTVNGDLKPGACADVPAIAAGAYVLRFDESDGKNAMLCARALNLKPGDVIRIGPDDGAQCIQ